MLALHIILLFVYGVVASTWPWTNQSQSFIISLTRTKGRSCLIYIYIIRERRTTAFGSYLQETHIGGQRSECNYLLQIK